MIKPLLEVKNLTTKLKIKGKSVTVVDDLNFSLYPGKTLALVGESGCGKSMTALSLMRLIPKEILEGIEGEVLYQGNDLLLSSEEEIRNLRGSDFAMIFQNPTSSLNPVYSIGEQMREILWYHKKCDDEIAYKRIIQALKDVGISSPEERIDAYPHQMSGGMLQRVMIAMALLLNPRILIADEPTTALDVTVQAQVLELIASLQRKYQMALLLITHDMGVVAEIADEVMVMYATQNVEEGKSDLIFQVPYHPYTQGLFASKPNVELVKKRFDTIKGFVPEVDKLPTGCHFHPRCPFVMDKCRTGEVPQFVKESYRSVKCWLYEK